MRRLLCMDLDNTLIDRTGTFRRWACEFVDERGLDPHEVGWLVAADLDGFAERPALFGRIRERYRLEETAAELGITTGTVKSHASRGRERLREVLATTGGGVG